ncbi:DNA replication complex GINS protein SLD5-like [Mercenaria mercenaria]|uniref:DNA replication complex GINS protein SLD5-like n=1 Tax=Mercenaria mercenaria TaxID=6596 RepID=UPI00234F4A9C|nr:DNA replication complex GINS protein SLD5-like [Mercenaria mercenaria]
MSSALDVLEGLEDDSGDDTEAMTAADVLQKLEEAWLNEKFAPELLETRSDLVECMLEQITQMEENIRRAKKGDFKVSLHSMEIDRIRYILSSYLRCRLQKIERYTSHILDEAEDTLKKDEDSTKLSDEELTFAREYAQNMESHLQNLALRHMPQNLQSLNSKQTASRPNLDKYVFLRVNESTDGVLVEEETLDTGEEIVDLEKGDQHIMRYRPMMSLVNSGAVSLI